MRIPRFFLSGQDRESLSNSCKNQSERLIQILEPDLIHRMRVVLRLRRGDSVKILDNSGSVYECVIQDMEKQYVRISVDRSSVSKGELSIAVTVAQSVMKGERFDWCLEKLTELGATSIIPLLSERGVVRTGGDSKGERVARTEAKLKRWCSIVREAAEQSERAIAPSVVAPIECSTYLSDLVRGVDSHLRYICLERSESVMLPSALRSAIAMRAARGASATDSNVCSGSIDYISIVIGPEGGFTASEISIAENNGWQPVSLGSRILRSETAGVAAMAQIASLLDC